jgi:uncharacterized protein YuzE
VEPYGAGQKFPQQPKVKEWQVFKGMHISYDPQTDILNVELGDVRARRREGCEVWKTPEGYTSSIFDVTPEGDVLSIEILSASKKYPKVDLDLLPREFPVFGNDPYDYRDYFDDEEEDDEAADAKAFAMQCAKWSDIEDLKLAKEEFDTNYHGDCMENAGRWVRCDYPSAEAYYMFLLYRYRRRWNEDPDLTIATPTRDERQAMQEQRRLDRMTPEERVEKEAKEAAEKASFLERSKVRIREQMVKNLRRALHWARKEGIDVSSLELTDEDRGLFQ